MGPFQLLEPREEDELHKSRLLNVEEKPFKRITKRVQSLHSLARWGKPSANSLVATSGGNEAKQNGVHTTTSQPLTPTAAVGAAVQSDELLHLREELAIDFAAFDSSIARLQFLMTANEAERSRYGSDREAILASCQAVRDKTSSLREQLDESRAALERRKRFDDLADRITSNRMLRPRSEQATNLAKLEEECAQLEEESETYAVTWRERRDQFARIMEESMRLRRQIRDEKEEVERREGMGDDEGGDGAEGGGGGGTGSAGGGQTPRPGIASGNATPMPHHHVGAPPGPSAKGQPHPLAEVESQQNGRPSSRTGSSFGGDARTPARNGESPALAQVDASDSNADTNNASLKPRPDGAGSSSRAQSREGSAVAEENGVEEGDDIEMDDSNAGSRPLGGGGDTPMGDSQAAENTPRITVELEDKMDTT